MKSLSEAKPADKNLRGHVCQRPAHPDLDSTDRHAATEIPAAARSLRLVTVESGRPAASTALCVYRDLQAWLDTPFEVPPALVGLHDGQLAPHF